MMIYVVGDCEFDTSLYALRRADQAIRLRPKVFQMLLYLLTHRDRVVTKHDLREAIWAEQFISDETLESTVSAVRQALGDNGRAQRIIQTLPGHGYRLVAPVTECPESPANGSELPGGSTAPLPAPEEATESFLPSAVSHPDEQPFLPSSDLAQRNVPSSEASTSGAEHRQLTVLSCHLLETAPFANQDDLEAWHTILRLSQDTCVAVAKRFDGQVVHYREDGVEVYFGYPVAHEDDAQRAVHAGLEMSAALRALQERFAVHQTGHLTGRIAIHTGPAIVDALGASGRHAPLALGAAPRLAAELAGLALPYTVVISEATRRLVQGYFETQPLSGQTLPGIARAVAVYRVLRAREAQQRLDGAGPRFTPLVGRESEVALLLARWQQVQAGHGQVVFLHGEAGIGKSRLCYVLKEHLVDVPHTHLECRSSPYYQNTALYPFIDLIQRILQWQLNETPAVRLDKLVHTLQQCRLPVEETVPLLGALLALPIPAEQYPPLTLSPQQQRHKTLDTILAILLDLSESHPVVLILEDLHWTDPTTLEFLDLLIDHIPAAHFLLLLSGRLEFQLPWRSRSYFTQVMLPGLSHGHVAQMVEHLTAGKTLPDEVIAHIVDKTDGTPLFVEELTKAWLESGYLTVTDATYELHAPLASLAIPTTLQALLIARLDRMGIGKDIAQCGAILGRSFTYAWIQGFAPLDEVALQQALEALVAAELLYCRGRFPHTSYIFKHALIQDIAYQSLLSSTRQQYHGKVARLIEQRFAATIEQQPELLAHHYTMAGHIEQAIPYWQQAGERATRHSAHVEAVSHFSQGLTLLKTLPETPACLQQELGLRIRLGPVLMALKGYAAPDVEETYSRAHAICRRIDATTEIVPVLFGLWAFYVVRGDLQIALELGEQLLRLVEPSGDTGLRLEAHIVLGVALYFLGEFLSAREHLEQAIALYDPKAHRSHATLFGQDPGMASKIYLAKTLWIMGYAELAERNRREALELAEAAAHPHTMAFCLTYGTLLGQYRDDPAATLELAEQVITLADEQGFPIWQAAATILSGWALGSLSEPEAGLQRLSEGIKAWKQTGTNLYTPYWQALRGEAYARAGRIAEGLREMDAALLAEEGAEESVVQAELYRMKGELLLQRTAESDAATEAAAESCFQKSIEIARQQAARAWELRGALGLAHLWQKQGRRTQARDLLAGVYNRCPTGFETPDLQAAKAWLETSRRQDR